MTDPDFIHPPMQPDWIDSPHQFAELGDLQLESGEIIQDFRQCYVTHGELNADRSNLVLACISLTGNHHRLDFLVGPGKALDTDHYFVVCADPIGNGLSTSPSNSHRQPGMKFPRFRIRDMVRAQYRLLTEVFKVNEAHTVIGASMGGMQALQWAVSYPDQVKRIVAMTPMARTHPWSALVVAAARRCLLADPHWTGDGFTRRPDRGWAAHAALMGTLLSRTPDAVADVATDVHSALQWLDAVTEAYTTAGFDAHDYLYQSWAYEAHDVEGTPGLKGPALEAIGMPALILAPPLDLFNPEQCARDAAGEIRNARFVEIPSMQGHGAASSGKPKDGEFLNRVVREFLKNS